MDTGKHEQPALANETHGASANPPWVKPEIVSFEPAKAAEGISYNPQDGIANLT
jgi:hypothetical protein